MQLKAALLFLTYRCNLRCSFCLSFNSYWRAEPSIPIPSALSPEVFLTPARDRKEMSTDEIVGRVIPELERAGVVTLALSGGEVLARKDAKEIFAAIGRSRLSWCFDSNLMLLTEEIADVVVEAGCDAVFVSIDGPEPIHNMLRGTPRGFAKTVRGVDMLRRARARAGGGHPEIIVNCVVQPGNEGVADDMVRLAREIGADKLTFQLLSEHKYKRAFDSVAAHAAFGRAKALAAELGLTVAFYPLTDPDLSELADWFAEHPTRNFFPACDYVFSSLRIDPEGNVIPCLEHRVGNILTEDLTEIWTGARYQLFRAKLQQHGPFQACLRCCNLTQPAKTAGAH